MRPRVGWIIVAATLATGLAHAQTTRRTTAPATRPVSVAAGDRVAITHHSITVGNHAMAYTATAGTMAIKDESGTAKADIFFIAYTLDNAGDAAKRPVTFFFNGGPGAAAVWLHLGAAGPRRIALNKDGSAPTPPYRLADNASTWLDASDLVFIDPVGTGYSRAAAGQDPKQFYSVEGDVHWMGEFIRLYISRNQRWPSPKFLAGESYGTTRAALLSPHLLEQHGVALNGLIMISAALNFQILRPSEANHLPYALYLPSYTAVAWSHKKLPADLQANLSRALLEAEQFATHEYAPALIRGDALAPDQRDVIAARLSRLTGLSKDLILKAKLQVDPSLFQKKLLEADEKVVGRFDGRLTGYDGDAISRSPHYDPSLSQFLPIYSGTINDYVRRELEFQSDLTYEVLTDRVSPWNWGREGTASLYVGDNLRSAMQQTPTLRVLFAAGLMDLATPYLATDYTINHLQLPEALRPNIVAHRYQAGHMVYHDPASLKKLHEDVATFIREATPAR